ncbi:MAG: (Fe-S)-binding protein [Candidatus Xenobiia bacterium LiM19]
MKKAPELPGLDCGLCGSRTCEEFAARLRNDPQQIKRCIPLSRDTLSQKPPAAPHEECNQQSCAECGAKTEERPEALKPWHDSLGREFDFYLEHFPEDPGPREVIIPRNPMLTRELDITVGDILIGRPLGMSCGCPITHCGKVMKVEKIPGVIVWCVTGPLQARNEVYKDMGYYSAEAYEGMIMEARSEIKIGMRYYFQPRMCMLQWRHSGLLNYMNRTPEGIQVRLEGLLIG